MRLSVIVCVSVFSVFVKDGWTICHADRLHVWQMALGGTSSAVLNAWLLPLTGTCAFKWCLGLYRRHRRRSTGHQAVGVCGHHVNRLVHFSPHINDNVMGENRRLQLIKTRQFMPLATLLALAFSFRPEWNVLLIEAFCSWPFCKCRTSEFVRWFFCVVLSMRRSGWWTVHNSLAEYIRQLLLHAREWNNCA